MTATVTPPVGESRQVLDHGAVRLVDYMGTDLSIVRAARVSYQAAWRAGIDLNSDARLLGYLLKNKHSTPFEAVAFTFEVTAPIFVLRQWHRHRTWSYNEVSARYTELPELFYTPQIEQIGVQSKSSKQARDITPTDETLLEQRAQEVDAYEQECRAAFAAYRRRLAAGWPRELARAGLPVSTYSAMFATVNLHNLLRFLDLRLHAHAQYEIRVYAEALVQLIAPIVPVTLGVWEELRAARA